MGMSDNNTDRNTWALRRRNQKSRSRKGEDSKTQRKLLGGTKKNRGASRGKKKQGQRLYFPGMGY